MVSMRVFAVILSLIIFCQSLSVCGPKILHPIEKDNVCSINYSQKAPIKSCCTKLHKNQSKDTKDKKQKGCCGDNCKCITCAKVYLNHLPYFKLTFLDTTFFVERNIKPIWYHSFDFHPSLIHPPQV